MQTSSISLATFRVKQRKKGTSACKQANNGLVERISVYGCRGSWPTLKWGIQGYTRVFEDIYGKPYEALYFRETIWYPNMNNIALKGSGRPDYGPSSKNGIEPRPISNPTTSFITAQLKYHITNGFTTAITFCIGLFYLQFTAKFRRKLRTHPSSFPGTNR